MNFSLEELIAANENGSLEGLLLGYGMLPLGVLKFVLEETSSKMSELDIEVSCECECECYDHYDE